MEIEHLVEMTNQIAQFFRPASGPEQAAADIAAHLRRFWVPRMRAQLIAHYAAGGEGMLPEARDAAALLAAASSGPITAAAAQA